MTRPKVDPEKRQRTAQACDSCKRRKQKCNGMRPCGTCTKRHLDCQYTPANLDRSGSQESLRSLGSPTKRRHIDTSPKLPKTVESGGSSTRRNSSFSLWNQPTDSSEMDLAKPAVTAMASQKQTGSDRPILVQSEQDFDSRSRISNTTGAADEAEVCVSERMLQDSTGRLLYVGDSASLSYLQWIRMIVENLSGPSAFTVDPRRHRIMENRILFTPDVRPTGVLPDRRTADVLIKSFFINTAGYVEVFDRRTFLNQVNECYEDPLNIEPWLLCLLYLVFAVGLVMAAPFPGSDEEAIIDKLRKEENSRAELFFRLAKSLADPESGFEDAGFESIQALLLMSLYTLAVSKRNAAYAYYGMAVRSGFAMGLHREEGMVIFQPEEQKVRRTLWRTLFVFDRFLAACLGRPTAISEEDCSEHALRVWETEAIKIESPKTSDAETTHLAGLEATVKSAQVIGITLKKIYSKRRISTAVAQEIANHLEGWKRDLTNMLEWRRIKYGPIDATAGIAVLHANLLHCHSVILLTRPFFSYIINKARLHLLGKQQKVLRPSQRMETFAQACVEASQHTLALAQAVLDGKYLPMCNPFVIHFVFAAALVVLSNEFASLYHNPDARKSISSAIAILTFCSAQDAQAERVLYIVENFDRANAERGPKARSLSLPGRRIPTLPSLSQDGQSDPMAHFFHREKRDHVNHFSATAPLKDRPLMTTATMPPGPPMPSMMPPGLQQPSPEGSISLNTGGMGASGMGTTVDPLTADGEFDFDSLWNAWPPAGAGGVAAPPPHHLHPPESFNAYGVAQPHVPHQMGSQIVNVPMYQSATYR